MVFSLCCDSFWDVYVIMLCMHLFLEYSLLLIRACRSSHLISVTLNIWLLQIAGMAAGFNLVFEHDNLITAICFPSVVVNLLQYTLSRLVNL